MFRKLTIAGLLLLLIGATPALGQLDVKPGVRVGVNFANVRGDDVPDEISGRTGIHAGALLLIDPVGPIAFQPEALYSQKGFESEDTINNETVTSTFKVDYLQINGLLKLQIPVTGPVSPNVFVGPALGFKVNEEIEVSASGGSASGGSDEVSGTDFGAVFGGGVDISAGFGTLLVDARYDLGLTDIPDEGDDSVKNGVFALSVGLLF